MSTPGPERVPSTVRVGKKSGQGKPPAGPSKSAKATGARPSGGKGAAGKGPKGRKPITPVKVSGGRTWGPIAVAGVVVLIAASSGTAFSPRSRVTSPGRIRRPGSRAS